MESRYILSPSSLEYKCLRTYVVNYDETIHFGFLICFLLRTLAISSSAAIVLVTTTHLLLL